jgi:hypothetical protein
VLGFTKAALAVQAIDCLVNQCELVIVTWSVDGQDLIVGCAWVVETLVIVFAQSVDD